MHNLINTRVGYFGRFRPAPNFGCELFFSWKLLLLLRFQNPVFSFYYVRILTEWKRSFIYSVYLYKHILVRFFSFYFRFPRTSRGTSILRSALGPMWICTHHLHTHSYSLHKISRQPTQKYHNIHPSNIQGALFALKNL